jgi:hypothetical protein
MEEDKIMITTSIQSTEGYGFKPSKRIYDNKIELYKSQELAKTAEVIKAFTNKKGFKLLNKAESIKLDKMVAEELGFPERNIDFIVVNNVVFKMLDFNNEKLAKKNLRCVGISTWIDTNKVTNKATNITRKTELKVGKIYYAINVLNKS